MLKSDVALSLGMLRSCGKFPDEGLPEWANTFARRMMSAGVTDIAQIKKTLEQMEIKRRETFRQKLRGELGVIVPVTEFDEHLADMFNRFKP